MTQRFAKANLFSTPVWTVSGIDLDFDHINSILYEQKKYSAGVIKSNIGGWQSNGYERGKQQDPELTRMEDIVEGFLWDAARDFNVNDQLTLGVQGWWANINSSSTNVNVEHTHPDSILSSVLYTKCSQNSGSLCFNNPCNVTSWMMQSKFFHATTELNGFYPKIGDLIIFPAWIPHSVTKNLDNEERISIAFNFGEL